jgi:enoyl-CoA hydratase/carnithine racemase
MAEELIKVSDNSGIVTVTLNRPERLNALAGYMRRDLAEALEEAGSDPDVRVIVINGAGRSFCAGGDVHFMAELVEHGDAEEFARLLARRGA